MSKESPNQISVASKAPAVPGAKGEKPEPKPVPIRTGKKEGFLIEKDIKNNKTSVKITNVENELLYNYYNQSTWRNFKVIPFSNPKIKEYLPNYKEVYNTYKAVVQKMDNEITVKDAAE